MVRFGFDKANLDFSHGSFLLNLYPYLEFSILNFQFSIVFWPGAERRAPIIGRVCAFDAKIYKNVDVIFNVSACEEGNKKFFNLFYFCSALPSLLIEKSLSTFFRGHKLCHLLFSIHSTLLRACPELAEWDKFSIYYSWRF